jgi:nitrogen fixation protein FixH
MEQTKKSRFNWGTGIAIVYAAFAITMVGAVVASRKYDPGLVQKDYYALDLNYQDRMERKQNTASLSVKPSLIRGDDGISFRFPAEMTDARGTAKFYRPSTIKDDFTIPVNPQDSTIIATDKLASGRWNVELNWESNQKKYYWETAITLQ